MTDDGAGTVDRYLLSEADRAAIVAHYTAVAPLLVKPLGSIPIGWMTYPNGIGDRAVYQRDAADLPPAESRVNVTTASGTHPYVALSEPVLPWLARTQDAVELLSWTPTAEDLTRPAFGHITLIPNGTATDDDVFAAARAIQPRFRSSSITAFCVLDGFRGLTMWLSVPRGYSFEEMGTLMHSMVADATRDNPNLLVRNELKASRGNRVSAITNVDYPGRGVLLPYSVRGTPGLEVAWPIRLESLGAVRNGDVCVRNFAEKLAAGGDAFASLSAANGPSSKPLWQLGLASIRKDMVVTAGVQLEPERPRDAVLRAALTVLAGDTVRSAAHIRDAAVERGLLPKTTTTPYVSSVIHGYIQDTLRRGRMPALMRVSPASDFRSSESPDVFPDFTLPPKPRWLDDATIDDLIRRLESTSTGNDPAAFEFAVCDAFAALGFIAQHIGGDGEPSGIIDAPLADAAWRGVVACRTASSGYFVTDLCLDDLTRFCNSYGAVHAAIVGPIFVKDASLLRELRAQNVSLWTVKDLRTALRVQLGPADLTRAFEPGTAETRIDSIVWMRANAGPIDLAAGVDGKRKRVEATARAIAEVGWAAQLRLAHAYAPAPSPLMNEDQLLWLVDEALDELDPTIAVDRDTLDAAIAHLLARGFAQTEGAVAMKRLLINAPVRLEAPKAKRSTPMQALPPHVDPDDIWDACRYQLLAARSGLPGDAALEATFPIQEDIRWHGLEHSVGCTGPAALQAASAGYRFLELHDAADALDEYLTITGYAAPASPDVRGTLPEPLDEATQRRIEELEERYCRAADDANVRAALEAAMRRNRDDFTRISGGVYALAKARWDR